MGLSELGGKKVHFLGIGGIGVSALARILMVGGAVVSGSDVRESSLTRALEKEGARVCIGHCAANIAGVDLVVYSTAVRPDNAELAAARAAGIPVLHRSELLGRLVSEHRSIGVTGTNGKGTVSSMVAACLEAADLNPSFYIGAQCLDFGTNARYTGSEWFVAELDESDGTVCNSRPLFAVLNNLEMDHLNYYRDFAHVVATLQGFFEGLPAGALGVFNGDDEGCRQVAELWSGRKVFFGAGAGVDYRMTDLKLGATGSTFTLVSPRDGKLALALRVPGSYNCENAAAAAAVCLEAGVPAEAVVRGLGTYAGLQNRYTLVEAGSVRLVKDYISHPTGIRKVLETARLSGTGRLRAVFKPYRYTMINYHAENYAEAFRGADEVVVTEMWEADEAPIPGVTTPWLTQIIGRETGAAVYIKDMEGIIPYLRRTHVPGETIVFFGGDDLFDLADHFWTAGLEDQAATRNP
jgi:UDP-N-acetylmuramate--alanine ligase